MTAMDENPDIWEPYYTPDNGVRPYIILFSLHHN